MIGDRFVGVPMTWCSLGCAGWQPAGGRDIQVISCCLLNNQLTNNDDCDRDGIIIAATRQRRMQQLRRIAQRRARGHLEINIARRIKHLAVRLLLANLCGGRRKGGMVTLNMTSRASRSTTRSRHRDITSLLAAARGDAYGLCAVAGNAGSARGKKNSGVWRSDDIWVFSIWRLSGLMCASSGCCISSLSLAGKKKKTR